MYSPEIPPCIYIGWTLLTRTSSKVANISRYQSLPGEKGEYVHKGTLYNLPTGISKSVWYLNLIFWLWTFQRWAGTYSVELVLTVLSWYLQRWAGTYSVELVRTVLSWYVQCWAGTYSVKLVLTVLSWYLQRWAGTYSVELVLTVLSWYVQCWAGTYSVELVLTALKDEGDNHNDDE